MLLGLLLLRPDHQKVEDDQDQHYGHHGVREQAAHGLPGNLRISRRNQHQPLLDDGRWIPTGLGSKEQWAAGENVPATPDNLTFAGQAEVLDATDRLPYFVIFEESNQALAGREIPMKMSARNRFAGTVTEVKRGQVMAQVTIDIGGGNTVMSGIFTESADDLVLKKGDKVTAVIKSTDVIIFKD
jgi:molybdate transport system regulatory protein